MRALSNPVELPHSTIASEKLRVCNIFICAALNLFKKALRQIIVRMPKEVIIEIKKSISLKKVRDKYNKENEDHKFIGHKLISNYLLIFLKASKRKQYHVVTYGIIIIRKRKNIDSLGDVNCALHTSSKSNMNLNLHLRLCLKSTEWYFFLQSSCR